MVHSSPYYMQSTMGSCCMEGGYGGATMEGDYMEGDYGGVTMDG